MILKVGYHEADCVGTWRYYEDFDEMKISSFMSNNHYFDKKKGTVIYKTMSMTEVEDIDGDKFEAPEGSEVELVDVFDLMFCKESCSEDKTYITAIDFRDKRTNTYIRLACLSDTVFLMNDNGRTIDKY